MIIKPKNDMYFTGAVSGKRGRMLAGVLKEIDAAEIKHIDPADYDVVDEEKAKDGDVVPAPLLATKKKK